ncbi:MAG: sigma-54-dependent Fis family transcriptional regulator [Cocleimonas sp.]|nr:sigma-54-dependent Fis family transcriptional regulator [Cocleimonas sp.]
MIKKIIGKSPAIQESLRTAELLAATDVTTLILGATGTGKKLFAEFIQQQSPRQNKPFIKINCAAMADEQLESSLFGSTSTSDPCTTNKQRGYLAQANNGTLFLDKISELPLNAQGTLLDFLKNGEYQAPDSLKSKRFNVRIIAASSKNLLNEVEAGNFRQDLFYHLNIVPLELPDLKDCIGDTLLLSELFFQKLVKRYKLTPPNFSNTAQHYLKNYTWPGNVRELHNFCERMLILFSGQTIDVGNLPIEIRQQKKSSRKFHFDLPAQGIKLEQLEVDLYQQAIQSSYGNKSAAARLLGLSRDAFLYRLRKYGLR